MTAHVDGSTVRFEGLTKQYGPLKALDNVSLALEAGEFMALLGPSGSGKTTMLMALAGFVRQDQGHIFIGDKVIDRLPAHERGIGVVFQNYALFPHMTVAENLAYPLRRRGLPESEIRQRVRDALDLVRLTQLGGRHVSQLSGGQQQRVAIARAVIFRPSVLLLDEPMSALDRKLRETMQLELRSLQRELGATVLLVTHDQEEAMSMADRIAIINHGRMVQVGHPTELYRQPADAFVADFIGRTNFLPVELDPEPRIIGFSEPLADSLAEHHNRPSRHVVAGIRPEDFILDDAGSARGEPARIIEATFAGARQVLFVECEGGRIIVETDAHQRFWRAGETARLRIRDRAARLFERPND